MSVETLHDIAETRRSIYMLNDQLPVSKDEVVKLVEHAVLHTPSSFNSQSSRLVVLFGEDHQKLWQITEDLLRAMVNDDEKFKSTADKMAMFKAGQCREADQRQGSSLTARARRQASPEAFLFMSISRIACVRI